MLTILFKIFLWVTLNLLNLFLAFPPSQHQRRSLPLSFSLGYHVGRPHASTDPSIGTANLSFFRSHFFLSSCSSLSLSHLFLLPAAELTAGPYLVVMPLNRPPLPCCTSPRLHVRTLVSMGDAPLSFYACPRSHIPSPHPHTHTSASQQGDKKPKRAYLLTRANKGSRRSSIPNNLTIKVDNKISEALEIDKELTLLKRLFL